MASQVQGITYNCMEMNFSPVLQIFTICIRTEIQRQENTDHMLCFTGSSTQKHSGPYFWPDLLQWALGKHISSFSSHHHFNITANTCPYVLGEACKTLADAQICTSVCFSSARVPRRPDSTAMCFNQKSKSFRLPPGGVRSWIMHYTVALEEPQDQILLPLMPQQTQSKRLHNFERK